MKPGPKRKESTLKRSRQHGEHRCAWLNAAPCDGVQEVDPKVENDSIDQLGDSSMISDLTNAIPGIDEAMSFAEMLK